jgi:hypothetical protein
VLEEDSGLDRLNGDGESRQDENQPAINLGRTNKRTVSTRSPAHDDGRRLFAFDRTGRTGGCAIMADELCDRRRREERCAQRAKTLTSFPFE